MEPKNCAEFTLESVLACGKTTLLSKLKSLFPELNIYIEGVDDLWTSVPIRHPLTGEVKKVNVFNKYYKNSKKYAASFQSFVLQTRKPTIKVTHDSRYSIQERSILGDIIFADANYILGNMNDVEYSCYQYIANEEIKRLQHPKKYIYLYTEAKVCYERMHKRNRNGEEQVKLEYLELLEKLHTKKFLNTNNNEDNKFWVVDMTCDIDSNEYDNNVKAIINAIKGDEKDLDELTYKWRRKHSI